MTGLFADTVYWIALLNPHDQWHRKANALRRKLAGRKIFTTDEVLVEVLTHFAAGGPESRSLAVGLVEALFESDTVTILPQSRDSFLAGLGVYRARLDKRFSMTDCISIGAMRSLALEDVLTHDHHFTQVGFRALL